MSMGATLCSPTPDPTRIALCGPASTLSYGELDRRSAALATSLTSAVGDPAPARVAFMVPPGPAYAVALHGIWRAGGVAVPLALNHPVPEHVRVLRDVRPVRVLLSPDAPRAALEAADELGIPVQSLDIHEPTPADGNAAPVVRPDQPALILFTSGTTGRPKGVVTTHANLVAQTDALVHAWGWSADDRILHVLPLHHVHGIVNCLCCPLRVGATVEFSQQGGFDADDIWSRLAEGAITVFMAVPTIYVRLLAALDRADAATAARWVEGARGLRLAVSGSAALPVPVFERWRDLTGQPLLERYGMTEIGMALSNPLHGERRPGSVGLPLPGTDVRVVRSDGVPVPAGTPGELEVRGPQVFREYWERPDETAAAFRDGWFRTGDDVVLEDGRYRILGRRSVDILKSGGYKLSALEIESALLALDEIAECAVVGVPDAQWGQVVGAAIVPAGDVPVDVNRVQSRMEERLAPYKVPRLWRTVTSLPRNAMGKIQKPDVTRLFLD